MFKFRIYVAGDALDSTQAIANLSALCRSHLPNRHQIEVVDVFKDPKRALANGIIMTPTIIKLAPSPRAKIRHHTQPYTEPFAGSWPGVHVT